MRTQLFSAGALALAALALPPTIASAATDPSGVWLDDKGRGAVEIKPCGESLCGYVVWVKEANDQQGCGKQILGDVSHSGSGVWDNGWIYSPEKKKRYSVELKPIKEDQLRVKGYAGTKFFSKTMVWTKAPADLVRCDVAKLDPNTTPEPSATPEGQSAEGVTPQATPAPSPRQPEETAAVSPQETSPQGAPEGAVAVTPKTAEPDAPQKKPQNDVTAKASPQQKQDREPEAKDVPLETGPDLSDLPIDKYFKKTADGRCKLNLPWVKLDFACPDDE